MSERTCTNKELQKKIGDPSVVPTLSTPAIIKTDGVIIPPEFITLSTPALLKHGYWLYLCFRERDDSLWIAAASNGKDYDLGSYKIQKALAKGLMSYFSGAPAQSNNLFTLYRPAMTISEGDIYLSWTNKSDNTIGLAKSAEPSPPFNKEATSWTILTNPPVPTTPGSGPTLATFVSRIFLAYRDSNSNIYIGSTGTTWGSFVQVKDSNNVAIKSLDGPTLMAVNPGGGLTPRLWLCYRQVNTVYFGYASFQSDGYTVSSFTWTTIPTPCNAIDMPVVSLFGNNFYCGYLGSDSKLHFGCSYNGGSSWTDWGVINDNCLAIGPPAITTFGYVLCFAFQNFSIDPARRFVITCYHDFTPEGKEEVREKQEKQESTA